MVLPDIQGSAWGALAVVAGGAGSFITWMLSKGHDDRIADGDAQTRYHTVLVDTALEMVAGVRRELQQIREGGVDEDRRIDQLEAELRVLADWSMQLFSHIKTLGGSPPDPPDEVSRILADT